MDNAGKLTLDPAGTFGTGTGLWFGDGNTGFYESSDNSIYIAIGGTDKISIDGNSFQSRTNGGFSIRHSEAASGINPVFLPSKSDLNSGLGQNADDQLSLIAGGVEGMRISTTGSPAVSQVEIDQGTNDAPFFDFQATADGDATSAISTLTTSGSTTHHIQVEINGTTAWIACSTTDPS